MSQIYFCIPEIYKKDGLKLGFEVQNHILNLCSSAVNSQWLLCRKKAVVKYKTYLRFILNN